MYGWVYMGDQRGLPRMQLGVRCGMPSPNMPGNKLYSMTITFPSRDSSILFKLSSLRSSFSLDTDRLDPLQDRLDPLSEQSLGLQPVHEQILHPSWGRLVLRTSLGTWQRQDLPDLEKAFIHFRQHPFLGSNFYSECQQDRLSGSFPCGRYSGSSPRLRQSSIEQPLHPQVWQPLSPISVLLCDRGTTQTHDFLPPSVCLHFRQQYLYRLRVRPPRQLRDRERSWDEWSLLMVNRFLQLQTEMQFTYEQKNHHFGENPPEPPGREGIGKLLNKYSRKAVDDEQDSLIQRKKLVYPANSLNYSQIYSDLRIEQKEKVRPEQHTHDSKFFSQPPQSLNYVPKSLPKIRRNSHISHNRESTKYVLNNTLNQSSGEGGFRGKAFSISHYDIYKNETKRLQLSQGKPRESPIPINDFLISKNSEVLSQSYHKDEKNIKVDFESMAEKDLPDSNDQEIPQNHSTIVQKQMQIQPQHSLAELSKEQIKIEIPQVQPKGRKSNINRQEIKTQSKAESKGESKVEPEGQSSIEKQELLSRKDSKLSKHSIRSKQKEVKLQEIKREYSKKMEQQSKKEKPIPQQSKKEPIEDNLDKFKVDKQPKEIQLFERKIQKPVELPEIKRSISSIHQTTHQKEQMDDQLLKFNQEISKVRKEIHGAKEEMIEVKEEVHGFKQEVHARKESIKKQNSRVLYKKQTKKQVYGPLPAQSVQKQSKHESQFKPQSEQKEPIQRVQVVIDGDSRPPEGHKFVISSYIEVYDILKELQKDLKVLQINFHGLIKGVKKYLQVVALGGLDHVEQYEMPLNRLKIIKNALLYERISIVIIAFAFAVGKVKESLKYLINLVGYATNNTLLILKILEVGGQSTAQVKNPVLAKSDRLVMKRNFDTIRNNNDIVLDSIFKISKQEEAFYEPFKEILKAIGKSSIEQTFYNVLEYFSFFLCVSQLSKNLPFLAVAPNPYLRQSIDKRPTLVIDIIQVFCHGTKKSKSHVFRPHTEHFLNEMSQYYELISFTCAYPNQIDKVIDILDQKKLIKHRLYRHHALMKNNLLIKDPERIGRDPSRLIILDSEVALMSEEISNTIIVPSWKGNRNDTTLAQLCPILAAIALKKLDCRESTRKIHEQKQKNEHAGIKYLNFGINLQ